MRALRLALGLFTIIPVGAPGEPDRASVRRALLFAPAIGLVLGGIAAAFLAGADALTRFGTRDVPGGPGVGAILVATLTVVVLQILTGGLHLDGAADTADGLASRGDRDRTLQVMRDPAVGAMGALTIVVLLSVDGMALSLALLKGNGVAAVVVAVVAGRVALLWGARHPAARAEGLGAWVAGSITWPVAMAWSAVWLATSAGVAWLTSEPLRLMPFAVLALPVGIGLALAAVAPVRHRSGGITGDLLGAMVEVATTGALIVLALAP